MAKTKPTAAARLSELHRASDEAFHRLRDTRDRATKARTDAGTAATADLRSYRDAVDFRKRAADPTEHRRITLEFLDRVRDDGLLLEVVKSPAGFALQPVDPAIDSELAKAQTALNDARLAVRDFEKAHREEIAEAEGDVSRVKEMVK